MYSALSCRPGGQNESVQYLLTCVEISVLGEVMSYVVELFSGVVATVAVKFDTGGEIDHQGGQGGDLFEYVLVFLQHDRHVRFEKRNAQHYTTM